MAKKSGKRTSASPQPNSSSGSAKRQYLSQTDVPRHSLDDALRIPRALADNFGKYPTKPLSVADALGMTPTSGTFRMLCGASIAYGLTDGGYNANEIALTDLGRKVVAPLREGEDEYARRTAFVKPRVINEFLNRYNESKLPPKRIAQNVLEEMGVPSSSTGEVFDFICDGAAKLGLLREIKGNSYVDLDREINNATQANGSDVTGGMDDLDSQVDYVEEASNDETANEQVTSSAVTTGSNKRVFITHGKNKAFIEPIKKLLKFGELEAVVSVENQTVSKPVPQKVMEDMRSCGAAIIHVEDELRLMDSEANEHTILNPNVLIEIGAAMGLYGRRFILLVKDGVTLPSNLQGLYQVRYQGETLDGNATIKLLEAINSMKSESAN